MDYKYCPLCTGILEWGFFYGRNRQYCPSCGFINYVNPLPTTVALAERDGKILLIKRGIEPLKGVWTLPSGFMETGETPEQACLRELKEETSMEGNIEGLIGVFHSITPMYGDIISIVYYIKLCPGNPEPGDDADGVKLVAINEIKDLGFPSFNKAFALFKQKYFS